MVELRKRPAPPSAPPPAKKKAAPKPKPNKSSTSAMDTKETEAPAAKDGPLKVGDTITLDGFGGDIETNDEKKVTLAKLVEDSKAGVVLFTYPKASTPGCTTQACLFRDSYAPLTGGGLDIYGLSNDSPKANTTFKTKQNLPYPLLCDPKQTLIEAIGMKKVPSGTTRGVFVVDKHGKVLAAEPASPQASLDVVTGLVEKMRGSGDEKAAAQNKLVADVAAEVADTAEGMDRSKAATPV